MNSDSVGVAVICMSLLPPTPSLPRFGWLLQLVVWSIRSLVEIVFRWVLIAQRALSREMEFQADLVAASLTGSDALVHALHKLGAADEAWERAVQFASRGASEFRGAGLTSFILEISSVASL